MGLQPRTDKAFQGGMPESRTRRASPGIFTKQVRMRFDITRQMAMDLTRGFSDHQYQIYFEGLAGKKPTLPFLATDLERRAREHLGDGPYWYVAGGAGEETMAANRAAFERYRILPRMLRDISNRSLATSLCGLDLTAPLALAPIGVQKIVHSEGELATARAAASLRTPFILSTAASSSIEEVADAMGNAPRWFQLYWPNDQEVTKSFLKRAKNSGYGAIVVTLDTKMLAWRPRDLESAYLPFLTGLGLSVYFSDPVFRSKLKVPPEQDPKAAVELWGSLYCDLTHVWDDLNFLWDHTDLPIMLKGILHPDDARKAVEAGIDGIIVSNHGGRQVGGAIATLEALPAIVDAVRGEIPVLFDGGIRCGADMFKALALGADAVLLGRPYMWGLALEGEQGVREVVQRYLADFELTMAMAGCASLDEIAPEMLWRVP